MGRQKCNAAIASLGIIALAACGDTTPSPRPPSVSQAQRTDTQSERTQTLRTRKDDTVDVISGVKIADPYRWLEDGESAEVKTWTDKQNAVTRAYLDAIPGRDALTAEVTSLLHIGAVTAPAVRSKNGKTRYFHTKREGAQNQPTLYVRDGGSGKTAGVDRALIDVSALSADGTTALDWWMPSHEGDLVAWGRSENGSEDSTLMIRDVVTGKDLQDKIPYARHASVAWLPGGKEFYYSRYPAPGSVPEGDEKYFCKIFHHVMGKDPLEDEMVFGGGRDKTDIPQVMISPNGRWLVIRVHEGWDKSEVFMRDLALKTKDAKKWMEVAVNSPAIFDPIPRDDRMYMRTNDGASKYHLFAIDYKTPDRTHWNEILQERADVLDDVNVIGKSIVLTYLQNASTKIERISLDGKPQGSLELPGIGTGVVSGPEEGNEAFVDYYSFVTPPEVLRFDLKTGKSETWDRVGEGFSAADVKVQMIFATSKDGTKIPMFVVAKAGVQFDGNNPTMLWGYGGFNVNQTPAFSSRALVTVKRGGVWVTAVLRGGGEFGEAWHRAGMLEQKQNVFDDFEACARELIAQKITRPEKLGIIGGSNGGLLIAAAVTQHPELYRVGLSLVPLTDMVRYPKFRIAKLWVPEYGDPEKPEDLKWLYAYSPYHHVKDGVHYPSMLFTSAESDSRVDPMHARKMFARMDQAQHANDGAPSQPQSNLPNSLGDHPILLRLESKAGHGAGKPTSKVVEEVVDEMSFAFHELGVPLQ
ncbi:MAG: prolyl oligopeptidase family serine peptidase [Polyangiaceae bacterium]